MNRKELETHLNKKVEIKLFDGDILTGYLHKTHDEKYKYDPNLYIPRNYYFLTQTNDTHTPTTSIFKVSHVRKLRRIDK